MTDSSSSTSATLLVLERPGLAPLVVDRAGLAALLGVTDWTVDRWRHQRSFPKPIRASRGAKPLWSVKAVEEWLAEQSG